MPSSASPPTPAPSTLSLHDALPISSGPDGEVKVALTSVDPGLLPEGGSFAGELGSKGRLTFEAPLVGTTPGDDTVTVTTTTPAGQEDRKSTRLNSSHMSISYAVFCFSPDARALHSFPTRRSSDLLRARRRGEGRADVGRSRPAAGGRQLRRRARLEGAADLRGAARRHDAG